MSVKESYVIKKIGFSGENTQVDIVENIKDLISEIDENDDMVNFVFILRNLAEEFRNNGPESRIRFCNVNDMDMFRYIGKLHADHLAPKEANNQKLYCVLFFSSDKNNGHKYFLNETAARKFYAERIDKHKAVRLYELEWIYG